MFASIDTATVVVIAFPIGGGAGQVLTCGHTPTHGPVDQRAAVIKEVLWLPVLWPPRVRVLDCLYVSHCHAHAIARTPVLITL